MKSEPFHFGLIGQNIAYSKSAEIFNAIFDISKVRGTFDIFDIEPNELKASLCDIQKKGIMGLSVTIPFKAEIFMLLNNIDPVAQLIGAVNSIAMRDSKLYGFNTDVYGFAAPLKSKNFFSKSGTALILGCGGSAKAVVYSLNKDCGVKNYLILGRNGEKLGHFKKSLQSAIADVHIQTQTISDNLRLGHAKFEIVVNCTPLGGPNHPEKSPLPIEFNWTSTKLYYDLNYNSDNTVVRSALSNQLNVLEGSQMVVAQAIRSFELWTGLKVDFKPVYNLVFGQMPAD
jgi:shikimate dehydrogenase